MHALVWIKTYKIPPTLNNAGIINSNFIIRFFIFIYFLFFNLIMNELAAINSVNSVFTSLEI